MALCSTQERVGLDDLLQGFGIPGVSGLQWVTSFRFMKRHFLGTQDKCTVAGFIFLVVLAIVHLVHQAEVIWWNRFMEQVCHYQEVDHLRR